MAGEAWQRNANERVAGDGDAGSGPGKARGERGAEPHSGRDSGDDEKTPAHVLRVVPARPNRNNPAGCATSSSTVAGSWARRARARALRCRSRPRRVVPRRRRGPRRSRPWPVRDGIRFPPPNDSRRPASRAGDRAGRLRRRVRDGMGGAERLWWLLRHFGHDDCAVLLGGIDDWGGPLAHGDETDRAGRVRPARTRRRHDRGRGAGEAARRPEGSRSSTRASPARWRGEPNPMDDRAGPHSRRAQRAVERAAARASAGRARRLLRLGHHGDASCSTARSLRGRDGVLYPGSWSDWSTRPLPIERELAEREGDRDGRLHVLACRAGSACCPSPPRRPRTAAALAPPPSTIVTTSPSVRPAAPASACAFVFACATAVFSASL